MEYVWLVRIWQFYNLKKKNGISSHILISLVFLSEMHIYHSVFLFWSIIQHLIMLFIFSTYLLMSMYLTSLCNAVLNFLVKLDLISLFQATLCYQCIERYTNTSWTISVGWHAHSWLSHSCWFFELPGNARPSFLYFRFFSIHLGIDRLNIFLNWNRRIAHTCSIWRVSYLNSVNFLKK